MWLVRPFESIRHQPSHTCRFFVLLTNWILVPLFLSSRFHGQSRTRGACARPLHIAYASSSLCWCSKTGNSIQTLCINTAQPHEETHRNKHNFPHRNADDNESTGRSAQKKHTQKRRIIVHCILMMNETREEDEQQTDRQTHRTQNFTKTQLIYFRCSRSESNSFTIFSCWLITIDIQTVRMCVLCIAHMSHAALRNGIINEHHLVLNAAEDKGWPHETQKTRSISLKRQHSTYAGRWILEWVICIQWLITSRIVFSLNSENIRTDACMRSDQRWQQPA